MSLTLKAAATALTALLASGAANAITGTTIQNFASGNSSLVFFASDNLTVGNPARASVGIDLGYNLEDFLTLSNVAGTSLVWNFTTDKLTVNGVETANSSINWSSLEVFFATASAADTRWGVIAGDSKSLATSNTPIQYLSTSVSNAPSPNQQNIANFALADSWFNALNSDADGVVTSTSSTGYIARGTGLGANLNWNSSGVVAGAAIGTELNFFRFSLPEGVATTENQGGIWAFDGQVLSYTIAAVPEPEAYALLLAGLGLIGFAARRRSA